MKQFDLEAFLELLRDIVKTLIVSYCGGLKICINFDRERGSVVLDCVLRVFDVGECNYNYRCEITED